MNQEEGLRAFGIAKKHHDSGNTDSAIRFCKKALVLSPDLTAASALLSRLEKLQASGASSSSANPNPSSSTTAPRASTSSSSSAPKPKPAADEKPREFTPAQAALVKRVKTCKVTEYYAILGLEKSCTDGEVKKAYRKMALGLHPDKCGAPGAEEAFKMVSKAFQVLSDSNKRAIFDQTGGDPDSRGGGGGGGMASNFARGGGGGMGGAQEMSPEDLFQFFFGGGGGGGAQFGGGGGFGGQGFGTQFYGPGGIRFSTNMPGQRQQRAGGGGQQQANGSVWLQIAPLLVLFAFSLLTQLPSLFSTSPPPDPDFSWEKSPQYSYPRTTSSMHVDYFVNPHQFAYHPIYAAVVDANPSLNFQSTNEPGTGAYRQDLLALLVAQKNVEGGEGKKKASKLTIPKELRTFERKVEQAWVNELQRVCQHEINVRNERLERARGFFGIGADWDKVREITNAKLEHCERLSGLGYRVQY